MGRNRSIGKNNVLLTWVAVNNDPFEREPGGEYRKIDSSFLPGPTLTLLEDTRSPYAGTVSDVIVLHQDSERAHRAFLETRTSLKERLPNLSVHHKKWTGKDPTDHEAIFPFIRELVSEIRSRFPEQLLLIHVSPGTPAMQTIWVLASEMGIIEEPFKLVKSYRKRDRPTGDLVVPFNIGIDSLYKALKTSKTSENLGGDEDRILTDPSKLRSDKLKQLYVDAERFARMNVPILIRGERGTGKTSLANWIRLNSPFRQKKKDTSWPSVACGQYSEETMRSELFGYCKGAFTGATEDRTGLLSHADGDTLFLDEIGDISRGLQRMLIKAIEEKRFLPLGSQKPEKSNFRLISATNITNQALTERLDPDFLDRVGALELTLPPLRETPEELPWMWRNVFSEAFRRASGKNTNASASEDFHKQIIKRLQKLPLYGNIRDLFTLAWPMIAMIEANQKESEAIAAGFDYFHRKMEGLSNHPESITQSVLQAYVSNGSMEAVVEKFGYIETKIIEAELQNFMASGLLRFKGKNLASTCDVSPRTLRNWKATGNGK